ncbi:MAG: mechanosensitive ion channel family protein [Candidatus Acidiferrales bacterium]
MEILIARGLRLVVIFVVAFLILRLLKALTSRLIELAQAQTRVAQMREQQTRTMAGLLNSAGTAVIVLAAFLAALPEFGFSITPVAAAAGLASLAVGFGAQSLVKDIINGFFIVLEDQFVVGDLIRANGETGRVEHLTLRRTVMRNDRGAMVTIPNGLIGQVANLNRDWSQILVEVTVPSAEAVGQALAVLEKIAGEFRSDPDWSRVLVDGPRVLGVESLTLEGTNLRLLLRTALGRQDDVARELRRRIKIGLEQAKILATNPQRVELIGQDHRRAEK